MNVTKTEVKYSQLQLDFSETQNEGLLQKNSAEHEGYVGAYNSVQITENNITNADKSKEGLPAF